MDVIEVGDPADPRLADYFLLNDQQSRRSREGDEFFIAEGYVSIDRVIDSGHALRSVLLTPSRVDRFAERIETLERLGGPMPPVYVVERSVMVDVVGFDLHRGVVASAARRPLRSVADIAASDVSRVAVLVGLNDAENVGVIARAARALGVEALVLDPTCTDPYARRTIRVSMGEILHLPVARATQWPADLDELHRAGFDTWALTPASSAVDIWRLDVPERLAVLLGAEGPGLDAPSLTAATQRVRIPIDDGVDSLNVGHAAAVAFAITARPG